MAQGRHTPDSQKVLGRCRAQARNLRDARIRREADDVAGAARAERRVRRGTTAKEDRERLAAARGERERRRGERIVAAPKPKSEPKPEPKPATPARPTRDGSGPEEDYRSAVRDALVPRDVDGPDMIAAQARLDEAAARFAALPSKQQAEVASGILGMRVTSGAEARRLLAKRYDDVSASTVRSREIANFGTAEESRILLTPLLRFPAGAARASRAPRAPRSAAGPAAPAAPKAPRPAPTPKVAAAADRVRSIQAGARGRSPDQIERDVDAALAGMSAAEARSLAAEFVGVDLARTKKAARAAILKRIDDVRASHERSAEILSYKARGGRRKGDRGSPATPPNVSAAAARVAKGEGTSADQKLLRSWEKAKQGKGSKPVEAYLGRADARELASHRAKLKNLDRDWEARLDKYDAGVALKRSALDAKVANRPDAARRLEAFDRKAAEGRPTIEDRDDFIFNRIHEAYDVARSAHYKAREAKAELERRRPSEEQLRDLSRRDAARFVVRSLPESHRVRAEEIAPLIARGIYRERGGRFGEGQAYRDPRDPALYAAAEASARALFRDASGTKALEDLEAALEFMAPSPNGHPAAHAEPEGD